MKLAHIDLDKLAVSAVNMRHGRKAPDIADILPSVRARGVLVPILVRPVPCPERAEAEEGASGAASSEMFEIVAGRRRFHAALAVAEERRANGGDGGGDDCEPMPCAILAAGDDAAALEASLIENIARLDPDEVTRWETFTALVRQGRTIDDLSTTFGLPELAIRRTLALGNLLPRIRTLYRDGTIDGTTVRHLTLASKAQQKAWLALRDDNDGYCPTGHQLKAWLFGGQSIAARHALFDVGPSGLVTIGDLFGEDNYFADSDAFWIAQNAAIEVRRAAYLEAGWSDVVIVPPSAHFATWEYEKTAKRKGGRVYIDVRASGEVSFHEGYASRAEARRAAKVGTADADRKPLRPEVTSTMQTYIDLHRHAAVRAALVGHPGVALRMMAAHAITGSPLWSVRPEPQMTRNDAVRESVETSAAEAAFDARRRAALDLLGLSPERPTITGGNGDDYGVAGIFLRLLDLPDPDVLAVVAVVMGETLASGSAAVEAVGSHLGVEMAACWQPDGAFFDLIRDREVLSHIVAEVAGETVARANASEKSKTLKRIIRDHLDGADGRARIENWVPRWMAFPPSAYTTRGGVGTVKAHAKIEAARNRPPEPDPDAPSSAALLDPEGGADDGAAMRLAA